MIPDTRSKSMAQIAGPTSLDDLYTSHIEKCWFSNFAKKFHQGEIKFSIKAIVLYQVHVLVGGWATPLKNMTNRQLGWLFPTQYFWENAKFMATSHQQPGFVSCIKFIINSGHHGSTVSTLCQLFASSKYPQKKVVPQFGLREKLVPRTWLRN